jgi:phosphoribosyl 1,2-cyclic phosphodiesterase
MLARFWGTRGSLPVGTKGQVIREKIKQALLQANKRRFDDEAAIDHFIDEELAFPIRSGYGGDSACVEIVDNDHRIICDFGTGVRALGNRIMKEAETGGPRTLYFVLSHLHWDHIMGLPFFIPAHTSGFEIVIHGGHPGMEKVFQRQQSAPCFPVHWDEMAADITLKRVETGQTYDINGFQVTPHLQKHPDGSYGYRFERNGKTIVYSTDCEHKLESDAEIKAAIEFYRDADLVIFDSMYSLADMISIKEDWGHSSNIIGVDLCRQANVKHYCMFHHEPVYSDQTIYNVLQETIRYEELMREGAAMKVSSAYDGLEIVV